MSIDYMNQIQLTPFLVLGCISLLSTYLPARYQYVVIPLIYMPAIASLSILVLERRPQYLIDLAGGYLVSIPFIAMIGLAKSQSLRASVLSYITSLTSTYFIWATAAQARREGGHLFLSLVNMFVNRQAWERVQPPQFFAALTALSSIALAVYLWRVYGSLLVREQGEVLIFSATAASLAVALIVLYSLVYADSVALGLIIAASLTLAATLRVGVRKGWRRA
ncbi:MAG: hypothetical protein QXM16_05635 [Nitrososphaerota archaeon]